ncbi:MAG TPA: SCO family protein [Vicinamibacterales bacterium]|nr:SCO family protein [Vicinamibacterales bacterium]
MIPRRRLFLACATAVMAVLPVVSPSAQRPLPGSSAPGQPAMAPLAILKDVRIDQKMDAPVPLDLPFVDEYGKDVTLAKYFDGSRPAVLALVYYECPMLCTQVLNGLFSSIEPLKLDAGRDFDIVVVSFDPGETPAMALAKKTSYLKHYHRPTGEAGIHFLTGRQAAIDKLADAVGFRYAYDETIDQYAHPAAVTVLTPKGHVSKYLYGVEFAPMDFRFAMVSAGEGTIGTVIDQALMYCFHYDPATGKYSVAIMRFVRLAGVLTLIGIMAFIFVHLRRDRRQNGAVVPTATGTR